jgi:hypothetical protein
MDQAQLDGRTIRVNESRPRGERAEGGGAGGGGGGFNPSGKEDVKLYVGNLSFDTQQETIQKLFETCGTVSDCFMPTDRDTGRLRGFCFVTMPAASAEEAIKKLNGYEVDGRPLRVNEAQPKGGGGGGGGRGGGGGYNDGGGYGGGGGGTHSIVRAYVRCTAYPFLTSLSFYLISGYGGGGGGGGESIR